jgi:ABC-type transport system involved in cytochrome bd biosynthesis fused ATPase/permease subunit
MDLPEEDKESGLSGIEMLKNSSIHFEDVTYKYHNGRVGLDLLNLTVESGKLVAISGGMGAGKTIITRMLLQYFSPTTGRITINGIDIRDINKRFYRKNIISHCSAYPDFISDTVRNNIKLVAPKITDDEILETFREIGAGKLADTKGFLNMKISNRSAQGSEIKNVISIVRSILKPATFYLFNRCFAHMNADIIQKTIKRLRREGKTCIFITFNSVVCKNVDEICYIDKGQLPLIAPHKELLLGATKYAAFFNNVVGEDTNNSKPDIALGEKIEDTRKETFVSTGAVH